MLGTVRVSTVLQPGDFSFKKKLVERGSASWFEGAEDDPDGRGDEGEAGE